MNVRTKVFATLGLAGACALTLWLAGPDRMLELANTGWIRLQAAPAPVYFSVMTLAILLPVPASVLYVTAGTLYGVVPALLWIAPTLALNALLVHQIAGGWLRPMIERLVAGRNLVIPRLETRGDEILFISLIRITPGIPYFVQSWVLGLANVGLGPFLGITLTIQMLYAAGFVMLGRSFFEGDVSIAIGAAAVLIVVSILARVVHARFRARPDAKRIEPSPDPSAGASDDSL